MYERGSKNCTDFDVKGLSFTYISKSNSVPKVKRKPGTRPKNGI